jgi:hypothetical protein
MRRREFITLFGGGAGLRSLGRIGAAIWQSASPKFAGWR